MKINIMLLFCLFATGMTYAQHSISSYERYSFRDTQVKHCDKKDTSEIFYKGISVGYLVAEKVKIKKEVKYNNFIINSKLERIAIVYNELGQLGIKYFDPYRVVFVKGMQFDNAVRQMVEVDKALFAK